MKIVNLHTHFQLPENQIGLINHPAQLDFFPIPDHTYSIGFHPWDITIEPIEEMISAISVFANHPQVLAIGECGLDRSIETDMNLQKTVFSAHVEIARNAGKALIIHAVRSYSDLLQLKKDSASSVPWVLHGYKGNPETTRQMANAGFYFSFGASLLKNEEKQNLSLKAVPLPSLFLETDESTVNIESIYIFAAQVLELSVNKLKSIVFSNFQQVFKQ